MSRFLYGAPNEMIDTGPDIATKLYLMHLWQYTIIEINTVIYL